MNNTLHQTLERAYEALEQIPPGAVRQLSIADCACTLDTLPNLPRLGGIRMQLAERLRRRLNLVWISEGDLFEVFLVLEALWKYDTTYVSGECLAQAIRRLVKSEVRVGGPYYSNGTIEIEANLQIASFVQLVAKPLPGLDAFLHQIVAEEQLKGAELNSPYVLYLLSRFQSHPNLIGHILKRGLRTSLRCAITLAMTAHNASEAQRIERALCDSQRYTGFWPKEMLLKGKFESGIATTAFIVKVLALHHDVPIKVSSNAHRRHQVVKAATQQLFIGHTQPLQEHTFAAIDKICGIENAFEITLLSYFFAQALKHPPAINDQQFAMLGVANVCGWIAYTIYDDFLDDEGIPGRLPVANVAMRASFDGFRAALPGRRAFERYVAHVFTEMDEANAWEVHNCRFTILGNTVTIAQLPKYGRQSVLAERSFAHALGPMAVASHCTKSSSQQLHYIESAFRHYLIARQLSDDLHDWTADLQAGRASYVVIAILRGMRVKKGTYNVPVLLSGMQKQFRRHTMPDICMRALRHIKKARQDFMKSELLQANNSIYTLLDELESSLRRWLDRYSKAKALVAARVSYSS